MGVKNIKRTLMKMGRIGSALLLACVMAATASASETVSIPSNAIPTASGARPAPGPLSGELFLPGGKGPYPVIILLHGCAGIGNGRNMDRWASRLAEWGYASLVLDSFLARHVSTVCAPADQPKVTGLDRSGDVLNAAITLASRPEIDGARIGVIGFSHGGGTAVTLTRRAFENFRPGLIKAAVNYYGPCREPKYHGRTPLLSLAGEPDNWGDPARTCAEFDAELAGGQVAEHHVYPDVYHAFDNPDLNPGRSMLGHTLRYDWRAAEDSYVRTQAFLDRHVRDQH